ncbi:MAG: hypothetical protein H0V70_20465 [Ktedonobacteraceae bacterium]|nr:hypothetical protein [Ktedonobacteraceae bacterium]
MPVSYSLAVEAISVYTEEAGECRKDASLERENAINRLLHQALWQRGYGFSLDGATSGDGVSFMLPRCCDRLVIKQ